jgi:AraC family transcriptional activator FtrA
MFIEIMPYEIMTIKQEKMSKVANKSKKVIEGKELSKNIPKVAVLVYDGLCTFEYGIVTEVLGLFRTEVGGYLYNLKSVSFEGSQLQAAGGLTISADGTLNDFMDADIIVIPGWRDKDSDIPDSLIEQISLAHRRGAILVSICSGIYVLAASGVLNGRKATTHWRYIEDIKSKFPLIEILANDLYVDQGDVITSAGSSAGLDVCLHLVRSNYGANIANKVARRLVIHAHREGGQAQFIEQPLAKTSEHNHLSELMDRVRGDLAVSYSINSMAAIANMSPRTLQRRFVALTGIPIAQWLINERLSKACDLLESSSLSLVQISEYIGFKTPENMRYHFKKAKLPSPNYYRKRFLRLES